MQGRDMPRSTVRTPKQSFVADTGHGPVVIFLDATGAVAREVEWRPPVLRAPFRPQIALSS